MAHHSCGRKSDKSAEPAGPKRGRVFSQVRVDEEQVQQLRRRIAYACPVLLLGIVACGFVHVAFAAATQAAQSSANDVSARPDFADQSATETGWKQAEPQFITLENGEEKYLAYGWFGDEENTESEPPCDAPPPNDVWQTAQPQWIRKENGERTYLVCGWIGDHPATTQLSPIFTPEVRRWAPKIVQWAAENGLNPNLVATIMTFESCGGPQARSRAGAIGLFQVMPFHFGDGQDPYDPDTNAQVGLAYLAGALELASGNASLAAAGYNGGHGVISWDYANWPAETQRFSYLVGSVYADAVSGIPHSSVLEDWYTVASGGMCRRAAEQVIDLD